MSEFTSMRPYMLRAVHEWCTDNGLTPYVLVRVDSHVQVPREFVKNGEIVLNTSYDATSGLVIDAESLRFKARFAGAVRDIWVPIERIAGIFARENGQGMSFPIEETSPSSTGSPLSEAESESEASSSTPSSSTPSEHDKTPHVLQLVSSEGDQHTPTDEPPKPPSPPKRPMLKRIK